ncbi:hypothetical protein DYB28_001362, partial [Aphanomyces astaci]
MEFTQRPSSLSSVGLAPPAPAATNQQNVRYYHPAVLSQIREDCMAQKLHLRASEFTEIKDMVLWTGTFNVNAKKPVSIAESAKLLSWLRATHENDQLSPDIVAVGFQEIVDLNAVNVVVNNMSGPRSAQWEESILAALNTHMSDQAYEVVLHKHLVGILLLVFVKRNHLPFITDVVGSTAGVGIMGMMGNKGGVAVRMTLYDSTIVFVCSHLAAHTHNVAGRNADFANILAKIEFRDSVFDEMNPSGFVLFVLCDRILWKAKADTVALQHYGAAMELDMSDHKPVAALFHLKVKYEVDDKKEAVQREISRELDKWESDNKPKVIDHPSHYISISDNNLVHFDKVTYLVPQTKSIVVENSGLVVAHFQLAPKLLDSAVSKLQVTVLVGGDAAHALSSGRDTLDDTLILRVANGADHFVVISADYLPYENLSPIRHAGAVKREAAVVQKIPKELWRMVDALYTHGLDAPNIFVDTDL